MAELTAQQALERAADWLREERGVTIDDDGAIVVEGNPPIGIGVTADDERLVITHVREEAGAGAGRADAVVSTAPERGTLLDVSAAVTKSGVTFTFTNPVYLDGLSRHAFVTALNELVAVVDRVGGGPTAETRVQEPVSTAPTGPAPDVFDSGADATAAPSEPTTDTAEVEPVSASWTPTHRVPDGGMRAWEQPDPSLQPSSRLEARVELQIAERRGDWARGVGSNGWTGWVDARKLEEIGTTSMGRSTIDVAGLSLRPLPLVGAAGLLLAAFLPWVDAFGASANSFDVALSFLWDVNASGSDFGFLVVALAVVAVVLAALPRPYRGLLMLAGVVTIAVGADFIAQMYRGVADIGGTLGDTFDYLGFAPWVMLASGITLLAGARR